MNLIATLDGNSYRIKVSPFDTPNSITDRLLLATKTPFKRTIDWSSKIWRQLMESSKATIDLERSDTDKLDLVSLKKSVDSWVDLITLGSDPPIQTAFTIDKITTVWTYSPNSLWRFSYIFDNIRLDSQLPACAIWEDDLTTGIFKLYEPSRVELKRSMKHYTDVTRTTLVIWFFQPEAKDLSRWMIEEVNGSWRITLYSNTDRAVLPIQRLTEIFELKENLTELVDNGRHVDVKGHAAIPLSNSMAESYTKFIMMDYLTSDTKITNVCNIHEPTTVNKFPTDSSTIVTAIWNGHSSNRAVNFNLRIANTGLQFKKLMILANVVATDYHLEIGFHKATSIIQAEWVCWSMRWLWTGYLGSRAAIYKVYRRIIGDELDQLLGLTERGHSSLLLELQAAEPIMFTDNEYAKTCGSRRYPEIVMENGAPFGKDQNVHAERERMYSCNHTDTDRIFHPVKVSVGKSNEKQLVPCCGATEPGESRGPKGNTYKAKSKTGPMELQKEGEIPPELISLLSVTLDIQSDEWLRTGVGGGLLDAVLTAVGDGGYTSLTTEDARKRYVDSYRTQSLHTKDRKPVDESKLLGLRAQMPQLNSSDQILAKLRSEESLDYPTWVKLLEYHWNIRIFCYSMDGRRITPVSPRYRGVLLPTDYSPKKSIVLIEVRGRYTSDKVRGAAEPGLVQVQYEPVSYSLDSQKTYFIPESCVGLTVLHNIITEISGIRSAGEIYSGRRTPLVVFHKASLKIKVKLEQWLDTWGKVRALVWDNRVFIYTPPMEPIVGYACYIGKVNYGSESDESVNAICRDVESLGLLRKLVKSRRFKTNVKFYDANDELIGVVVTKKNSSVLGESWIPSAPSSELASESLSLQKKSVIMRFYLQWDFSNWLYKKYGMSFKFLDRNHVRAIFKEWTASTVIQPVARTTTQIASSQCEFYFKGSLAFHDKEERRQLTKWLMGWVTSQTVTKTLEYRRIPVVEGYDKVGYKRVLDPNIKIIVGVHSVYWWLDQWWKGNRFLPLIYSELPNVQKSSETEEVVFTLSNGNVVLAQHTSGLLEAQKIIGTWETDGYNSVVPVKNSVVGKAGVYEKLDDIPEGGAGIIDSWAIF